MDKLDNEKMNIDKLIEELRAEGYSIESDSEPVFCELQDDDDTQPSTVNEEPAFPEPEQSTLSLEQLQSQKRRRIKSRIGGFLFYSFLIILVLGVLFLKSSGDGLPRSLLGYSAMTVLSESMQSEIPKDSLVVTKEVDVSTLKAGDTITYMTRDEAGEAITVTHKIVTVYKDYEGSGQPAFQTQGIENAEPDDEIVISGNVIGKVVFHSAIIGMVITYIQNHLLLVGIMVAMIIGLTVALKVFFKARPKQQPQTTV